MFVNIDCGFFGVLCMLGMTLLICRMMDNAERKRKEKLHKEVMEYEEKNKRELYEWIGRREAEREARKASISK